MTAKMALNYFTSHTEIKEESDRVQREVDTQKSYRVTLVFDLLLLLIK